MMSMKPGALALAGRRLPVNGEARHHSVGSSVHPPRPGGGTDADTGGAHLFSYNAICRALLQYTVNLLPFKKA